MYLVIKVNNGHITVFCEILSSESEDIKFNEWVCKQGGDYWKKNT